MGEVGPLEIIVDIRDLLGVMNGRTLARVTEAPVVSPYGSCCLDSDIHTVIENDLLSAFSAWDGDLYLLLPAVLGVVQQGGRAR